MTHYLINSPNKKVRPVMFLSMMVPENALSQKLFLDPSKRASGLLCRGFLYRKNRALTREGGGKRTVRGGSKTPFCRGNLNRALLIGF